ncbi:MAG: glycoside hydrolase family 172 protein, partial [Terracidiphilus sp.]
YQSALLAVAPMKALNAYFQMPFANAARITVSNEGPARVRSLYFAIDYVTLPSLPDGLGRFHAQYRQTAPCKAIVSDGKNLDGKNNYVFLEATGKGHFVGVTQSVVQNEIGWFGEGDDMIFIDGDTMPTINGTGTEDYFNGAWGYGGQTFANMHQGVPFSVDPEHIGGRYCQYRWHTEGPIAFEKSIKVTIEHGTANNRSDNFYSTAYWYQTEPHAAFPALPAPTDRVPKVFAVGGEKGAATAPGQ